MWYILLPLCFEALRHNRLSADGHWSGKYFYRSRNLLLPNDIKQSNIFGGEEEISEDEMQ
jgi:hypothetical protein